MLWNDVRRPCEGSVPRGPVEEAVERVLADVRAVLEAHLLDAREQARELARAVVGPENAAVRTDFGPKHRERVP